MSRNGETHEIHSIYKGYEITKVTQDSGRVTYDVRTTDQHREVIIHAISNLQITKAEINAELEHQNRYATN